MTQPTRAPHAGSYEQRLGRVHLWPLPLLAIAFLVIKNLAIRVGGLPAPSPEWREIVTRPIYSIPLVIYCLFALRRGHSLGSVFGRKLDATAWKIAALCALTFNGVVSLLIQVRILVFGHNDPPFEWLAPVLPTSWPGMELTVGIALSNVLVASVTEELIFRGLIFRKWRARWGAVISIYATSALFGIIHGNPIVPGVAGMMFALAYLRTDSLWTPIVAHVLSNSLAMAELVASWFVATGEDAGFGQWLLSYGPAMLGLIMIPWAYRFVQRSWASLGEPLPPDAQRTAISEAAAPAPAPDLSPRSLA